MATKRERYVPANHASIAQDAPGWHGGDEVEGKKEPAGTGGPICWKCRGSGKSVKQKHEACRVCHGRKRLKPKQADVTGDSMPGAITRGRKSIPNWKPSGRIPFALQQSENNEWVQLVKRANSGEHVVIEQQQCQKDEKPTWVPRNGEELCNLVGSWRILQRVGSHRWTTDDLSTAHVAAKEAKLISQKQDAIRYLDLGTGNASVLQMVSWSILSDTDAQLDAVGIEARSEAVQLARRSVAFNVGKHPQEQSTVKVLHGDFRCITTEDFDGAKFDLISGTPPYFAVDFDVQPEGHVVQRAIIHQGGMPTAIQSAPARCEFRGGVEAYCQAASKLLAPDRGRFCVCENYQNHGRVLEGAKAAGLLIASILHVHGREGKTTLFSVYTMRLRNHGDEGVAPETKSLAVRDNKGEWTKQYQDMVLKAMSIATPP